MTCLNVRELARLVNSKKLERDYEVTAQLYQKKYDIKVLEEDFQMLLQTANRINKREKGKKAQNHPNTQDEAYQIFVFGELKLFYWVLILYSHANSLELTQYKDQNFNFLQTIFKSKSRIFIQFQIKQIIGSKSKFNEQWAEQQIKILQQIIKKKNDETEWKAISFELFRKSEKKYYRSYAACREKWINHLNPNVKKGSWTLQEEIQLFSFIAVYGCRWALISKEMKGSRSEHNIKNKYNSVVRSIKKQYRLSETSQLSNKVLKYLKLKLERQVEKERKLHKKLNKSVISADSLSSRDRSRQLNKDRLNDSIVSVKSNSNSDTSEKCVQESKVANKQHQSVTILKDCDFEIKQEKKTNDREQNEQSKEANVFKQQKSEDFTNVRMLTLCEIESEYNRLLSFNLDTRYKDLFDDEQDFSDNMYQKSGLMLENELYGYSWYNHNE